MPETFEGGSRVLPNVGDNEMGKAGKGSGASQGDTAEAGARVVGLQKMRCSTAPSPSRTTWRNPRRDGRQEHGPNYPPNPP